MVCFRQVSEKKHTDRSKSALCGLELAESANILEGRQAEKATWPSLGRQRKIAYEIRTRRGAVAIRKIIFSQHPGQPRPCKATGQPRQIIYWCYKRSATCWFLRVNAGE